MKWFCVWLFDWFSVVRFPDRQTEGREKSSSSVLVHCKVCQWQSTFSQFSQSGSESQFLGYRPFVLPTQLGNLTRFSATFLTLQQTIWVLYLFGLSRWGSCRVQWKGGGRVCYCTGHTALCVTHTSRAATNTTNKKYKLKGNFHSIKINFLNSFEQHQHREVWGRGYGPACYCWVGCVKLLLVKL